MKISNIINNTEKPQIYEPGTHKMWTDEHISKQLLQIHLNKDLDLASRKESTIVKTVDWILSKTNNKKLNILDLGCGPGLYTERYAKKGHNVTGVDFSKTSIDYASEQTKKKNLNIEYINKNYLELELPENSFDLVTMIYTDFGVLFPEDRIKVLQTIKKSLKPGGLFIFDVLNDNNWMDKISGNTWECCKSGFWSSKEYLALFSSHAYKKEKVILHKHLIIDENDNLKTYHFWTHFMSHNDLEDILGKEGFCNFSFHEDVLPQTNLWDGKYVSFVVAQK